MTRRVATITLNPAYDLIGLCPEIEVGEVNLVRTASLNSGARGSMLPKYCEISALISPLAALWAKRTKKNSNTFLVKMVWLTVFI